MIKNIYSTCIGLLLTITASATEFFNGTYDEAVQKAKQENKHILLYFTAKWCYHCKRMEKLVYPTDSITQQIAQQYIALKVDVDSYAGDVLKNKYTTAVYPTFVIIDQEANAIRRETGFLSVRRMFEFLTLPNTNTTLPRVALSNIETQTLEYNKTNFRPFKPSFGILAGVNQSAFTDNSSIGRIGSQLIAFVSMQNNHTYAGRFLIRPGVGYLSKGSKSTVGHFLHIPVDFGYTFLRSGISGIPVRIRIIGSPYYSIRLNHTNNLNRYDAGFRSGISFYLGERSEGSSEIELLILYEVGMTDALIDEAGVQRNQLISASIGLTL